VEGSDVVHVTVAALVFMFVTEMLLITGALVSLPELDEREEDEEGDGDEGCEEGLGEGEGLEPPGDGGGGLGLPVVAILKLAPDTLDKMFLLLCELVILLPELEQGVAGAWPPQL
jgi:hypothetical protein